MNMETIQLYCPKCEKLTDFKFHNKIYICSECGYKDMNNKLVDERNYAVLWCDNCEVEHKVKVSTVSDLFHMKCPKCGKDTIWFRKVCIGDNYK